MSGPKMLLKAAISAFVPKETAVQITATIEGMLRDGSLDGIATLVTDVREIKESLSRIEFQNAKLFAALQSQQYLSTRRPGDGVPGGPNTGPCDLVVTEQRPVAVADHGIAVDAGGEPDGMGGGSDSPAGSNRSEAAE